MKSYEFCQSLGKSRLSYNKYVSLVNMIINDTELEELYLNLEKRTSLLFIQYLSYLPIICKSFNRNLAIYANEKTLYLMQQRINSLDTGDFSNADITNELLNNTKIVSTEDEILEWVSKIATEAPVFMDDRLQNIFTTYIGEIFHNCHEHASAKYVVGSKYSKRSGKIYTFSIYDTGKGIPENVRLFQNNIELDDRKAIEWALGAGHSTAKNQSIPRGAGFNLLHSFAENNNGEIRILSGKCLYIYNSKTGRSFYELKENMVGTLFEMDIVCDPNHRYILK